MKIRLCPCKCWQCWRWSLYLLNYYKQIWGVERAALYWPAPGRAALSLAKPLCGTILADWMPNRDILVDWPGHRDKALNTWSVPAKTGRIVCLIIGKYIFVIFFSLFVIRNFRGTGSSIWNAEGVNGQRKFGNRCYRRTVFIDEIQ